MGHCENCGTRLERTGCPNCDEAAFFATQHAIDARTTSSDTGAS